MPKLSVIKHMDDLLSWSENLEDIGFEISRRPFKEYIAWKIPFPMKYIDEAGKNMGIRIFCADRMLSRMSSTRIALNKGMDIYGFCRVYCVLTWPNLFASEVGIFFSERNWISLTERNLKSETFSDIVTPIDVGVGDFFGNLTIPSGYNINAYLHCTEDLVEGTFFESRILIFWSDLASNEIDG